MADVGGSDRTADSSGGKVGAQAARGAPIKNGSAQPDGSDPAGGRIRSGVVSLYTLVVHRRALERVRNDIQSERAKIKALTPPGKGDAAADRVLSVLEGANALAATGDIDGAWRRFHAARELEILRLEGAALEAAAEVLRHEAEKLNAWRKCTVGKLLDASEKPLHPEKVARAAAVVHEHYQNQAYKDGLRRVQLWRLALALVLGVAGLLLLAHVGYVDAVVALSRGAERADMFAVLLCLAVTGFCGAAFSAAVTFQSPEQRSRIPELMSTIRVTMLRLVLGALSAIIVFFALRSDAFEVIDVSGPGYLLVAFAAGFSERLVGRFVANVTDKTGTSDR